MTAQVSSVYQYDNSLDWTENSKRKAYAICAAKDQDVLAYATSGIAGPPVESTEADALIKLTRDEAAETVKYFETEHEKVVADAEADTKPVDIDRAVCLGIEMARKQGLETTPEAVAYATERLKSKIWRDAVHNPIKEVHDGFLSYRFLKGMPSGENVVYVDRYKRGWERAAAIASQAQQQKLLVKPPGLLKLTWIHETEEDDEREWLVYGMCAKGEMSVVFGEPSAGKSIIAGDIALHVAHGMPWFGMETTKTTVLYYAAERAKLVKRRLRGLEDYHEIEDVTKVIIGSGALDIRNERDTRRFINDIKRASADSGEDVGLVIIDTFSRSLNGGDENSQSDVGDAVKNMQRIADETGVHLMAIHHVGVSLDAKKRMRGSSVLTGGIDKSFLVTQAKKGELTIAGVKDNDPVGDGAMPPLKMLIRTFKTGVDASGRDVTVPCLTPSDTPEDGGPPYTFDKAGPKLTAAEKDALAARTALAKAIEEHGVLIVDDAAGFPDGVTTVSKDQWRAVFKAEDTSRRSPDALRIAFNRALKTTIETGQVNARNDHFWPSE
jgi:archaellum biogenesis ATPase FlaH